MSKLKITETILRDSQQSLLDTRMTTDEMLPILSTLDKVGYHSLECWGGETFETCLKHLHEDPWQRLRIIRDNVHDTKLQMLFRGQNILGHHHYSDDVVEYFVQKSFANGIDIIRVFDPLNDPRNLETVIRAAKREKGHVQVAICFTTSPVHNNENFTVYAKQLEEMGADSICLKDVAGLLRPYDAYQLIRSIRSTVNNKIPLQLHTHCTSGLAAMTTLKAAEAGIDIVDTAISSLALGTSQPPTESVVATFAGTPYDTGLNVTELEKATMYFDGLRHKYLQNGTFDQKLLKPDVSALQTQIPGNMFSMVISQLKQANRLNSLKGAMKAIAEVREDAGFPPLVTPISQIIATQAVLNTIYQEPYKMVSNDFKSLIRGDYGKLPGAVKEDFRKKILGDEEPITYRPADKLEPQLERFRSQVAPYAEQEEDLLSLALFQQTAIRFFEWRRAQKYRIDPNSSPMDGVHPI